MNEFHKLATEHIKCSFDGSVQIENQSSDIIDFVFAFDFVESQYMRSPIIRSPKDNYIQ